MLDLNQRPHPYQGCALPPELIAQIWVIPNNLINGRESRTVKILYSLERRWSSRRFPYGYLVTTSPQSLTLPWPTPSKRLGYRLRVKPTPMVWRAVCTRPGNVFTVACWSTITSDSDFMFSSCREQSELRRLLRISSRSPYCILL